LLLIGRTHAGSIVLFAFRIIVATLGYFAAKLSRYSTLKPLQVGQPFAPAFQERTTLATVASKSWSACRKHLKILFFVELGLICDGLIEPFFVG
jgi:hypothetical protein